LEAGRDFWEGLFKKPNFYKSFDIRIISCNIEGNIKRLLKGGNPTQNAFPF
jgi:hypothetical protein